jgi:two-component system chemotaxis response regulator CheY
MQHSTGGVPVSPTVLVIDDIPIARTFNSTALQSAGYTVVEADNGLSALVLLDGRRFDAVVCDFQMPQMDGLEFVKAMRASAQYRDIPVLMLSADGQEEAHQGGEDAGASAWLLKPVSRTQLIAAVGRLIQSEV